VANTDPEELYE
jgi:hypothetical protein